MKLWWTEASRFRTGCPLRLEKLEILEILENEPFSEFVWKSWKTIGCSPALAGKAEIFYFCA